MKRWWAVAVLSALAIVSSPLTAAGVTDTYSATTSTPSDTGAPSPTPTVSPSASTAPTPTPSSTPPPSPSVEQTDVMSLPIDQRVSRLIVKYRDGVVTTQINGLPTGADDARSARITGGSPLVEDIVTMSLEKPVSVATAEKVAAEVESDPAVEWAQPDYWRRAVENVKPAATIVSVSVSGPTGTATKSNAFTYLSGNEPTLESLNTTVGPTSGGTVVTLTGTNLANTTSVSLGGANAQLGSKTATSVTFTTSARSAGTVDVIVTTPGGQATLPGAFTYIAAPTISSLTPSAGPIAGGQSVTLTGSRLGTTSSVMFGSTPAPIISVTATSVMVTAPARAAGTVNVTVTAVGGTATRSNAYTYVGAPTVTSLSTTDGGTSGGKSVTIAGTNLRYVTSVTFGDSPATIQSTKATSVTVTTPSREAGLVDVTVTGMNGAVTRTFAFTYVSSPTLASLNASYSPLAGGVVVTATGTNLLGVSTVTVGGASATNVTVLSNTSVRFTTPSRGAGTYAVAVSGAYGSGSLASALTYVAPPTVSSLSQVVGSSLGGQSVTVTGSNLTLASRVTFGGVAATILSTTATSVTVTTPARSASATAADVSVTTPGGTATRLSAFTFATPPTISSASPSTGGTGGGTSVTIVGTNLQYATSVSFAGTPGTLVSKTATSLVARTPVGLMGPSTIVVTGSNGSASRASGFSYVTSPPVVTAMSPSTGSVDGGTTVTVSGSNLGDVTGVSFGANAGVITAQTPTSIRVTIPSASAGATSVVLSGPGGLSTPRSFTYVVPPPTVASVSPSAGRLSGGETVTLIGTRFSSVSSVRIGSTQATAVAVSNLTIVSDTQLTFRAPASLSSGSRNIYVTASSGTGTRSAGYTYVAAPTITSLSPSSGSATGGTSVTITGTNLKNPSSVRFGANEAVIVSSTSTSISVTAPSNSAGTQSVVVTTAGGSATAATQFTYLTPPARALPPARETSTIPVEKQADVIPLATACPDTAPGRPVQRCFDDDNLDAGASLDGEIIYSDAYVTSSALGTLIVDVVPYRDIPSNTWLTRADTVSYILFDKNDDGIADVKVQAPETALAAGASTTALVLDATGATWNLRGGTGLACSATITRASGTHIFTSRPSWWQYSMDWACLFGSGETAASIDVLAFLDDNGDLTFTDSSPDVFSGKTMNLPLLYVAAPTITSVTPGSGPESGGTTVTLSGTGLNYVDTVKFGDVPGTIISVTPTTIVALTPPKSNAIVPTETTYSDGTMWGLTGQYGIQVGGAWNRTQGSPDIIVAVVDTGITTHSDLGPQVPGYDMISDSLVANDGNARDSNPSDPGDWITSAEDSAGYFAGCGASGSSWHGTHVAGTINATINGSGAVGVAPFVKVQPIRVLGKCGGYTSDIIAGIRWAAGQTIDSVPNPNPADVISLSLGGGGTCSSAEQNAINYAISQGAVVTIAAGNEDSDASNSSPGNCAGVITVAATDTSGKRASFSNFGSFVEIAAPGVGIYSTLNSGAQGPTTPTWESYSGTSMATPHVAGVAALILSRNPALTPAQVLDRIQSTATAFPGGACDPVVWKTCGVGILNANGAVP